MAKSWRFAALVLLAFTAEGTAAPPSPAEMASTLAHVTDLMTRGVAAYLDEAQSARADREARALIHSSHEPVAVKEVEQKAMDMAGQMLSNLRSLAQAAKKLESAVITSQKEEAKKAPPATPEQVSSELEGRAARLEKQVAGLRETNHELEEEKRSLIASVQSMLHNTKTTELHEQLKACHEQQASGVDAVKAEKEKADEVAEQLRADNTALMNSLDECQKSPGSAAPPSTQNAVVCETKLHELQAQCAADAASTKQVEATVNMLSRENEELKAKVKGVKDPCPICPTCGAEPELNTVDLAHMAETTKIDSYISQSEGELAAVGRPSPLAEAAREAAAAIAHPAKVAVAAKPANHTNVTAEPVKPIHLSKDTLKGASSAVAGQGAIGRYLRGDKTTPAPPAAPVSTLGAATGNASIEQALETIAKEPAAKDEESDDGDDLARRLLLQAEHNLKLAS